MPTLAQIKAKNPVFFNESNTRFFGTSKYDIVGDVLICHDQTTLSDRSVHKAKHYWYIKPDLDLMPIIVPESGETPFVFMGSPVEKYFVDIEEGKLLETIQGSD